MQKLIPQREAGLFIETLMDASILLIGNEQFQCALQALLQEAAVSSVEAVVDVFEAMPLILAQQPDLLIVQAIQPNGMDLCRQVKAQGRLAWIYCIVVDDQPRDSDAKTLADLELEALGMGADAYRQVPPPEEIHGPILYSLPYKVLQAQIQVGLKQVQTHRELMRTNDVLSAIALSDPLTDLNNRRAFEWELPRQIQNARDRSVPISLVMLDVDFFKSINDTYGHLVGDQVLRFFAARLRHNLRIYDTPFRYGGEEFVVILSNTDAREAIMIANRICQLIQEQPFAIDEALDLTITISAGTATLQPDDDVKGLSLLHRADQCLLSAKAQGRNRVVGCG
jgi:two-component system, cell cycle response regulator